MDGVSVTHTPLRSGDAGTRQTLSEMSKLVAASQRDLDVRNAAVGIVRLNARTHDPMSQAESLFEWVRDSIFFVNDPLGGEYLQSPRVTLSNRSGDCDDRATLLAAMLRTIGISTSFRVVAVDPRRPQQFSHVYVVAHIGGRDVPLDPTYERTPMGFEPPNARRMATVPA